MSDGQKAAEGGTVYEFAEAQGFHFPREVMTNYALSLASKPFVILTGISGTGKTKIAQLFADYMCTDESQVCDRDRIAFISVRPDWMDNRGLLGFYNLITERYEVTELLKLMLRAAGLCDVPKQVPRAGKINECLCGCGAYVRNRFLPGHDGRLVNKLMTEERLNHEAAREKVKTLPPKPASATSDDVRVYESSASNEPHFVVLDEMNLARVEQYFSDFLSCLETRRIGDDGEVVQEAIELHGQPDLLTYEDADGRVYGIPPRLKIPENLFFTGTVNIDETTYMFSPKVLDRASVIEFNEVDLSGYLTGERASAETFVLSDEARFDFSSYAPATREDFRLLDENYRVKLADLNNILQEKNRHFGYRTANEIARYLNLVKEQLGARHMETAFDLQMLQRVFPKLHGTRAQMEELLERLLGFAYGGRESERAVYPRSVAKLQRMLTAVKEQGFVGFIE